MDPRDRFEAGADSLRDLADKTPGRKTLAEFKQFLLRGNVVDLAVAVAVGAAFTAVVQSFVKSVVTPLIGLFVPGEGLFGEKTATFHIFANRESVFPYGEFLNTIVSFLVVAAVVFFFVVKPVNHLMAIRKTGTEDASPNKNCPECLSSIPIAAKRCAFCTSEQEEVPPTTDLDPADV